MTYIFVKNISANSENGTSAMFYLKEVLKTTGWIVKASGDGIATYDGYDVFTSDGSGVAGLGNANAWFRIQMPLMDTVNREYLIKRNSGSNWTISYSFKEGFIGGSPSATEVPTATDAYTICNNTKIFSGNQMCFAAAEDGYSNNFILCGLDSSTNAPKTLFAGDALQDSSYSSYEKDPYVIWLNQLPETNKPIIENISNGSGDPLLENKLIVNGWFGKDQVQPVEKFAKISLLVYKNQNGGYLHTNNNSGFGTDVNGYVDMLPIFLGRLPNMLSPKGCKGISSLFYFHSISALDGDTFTVLSERDRIVLGDINAPWDGSIPVLAI